MSSPTCRDMSATFPAKLETGIMFCNFRGKCKRTPDGKNCMNPTPEEAIKIVEVIIAFARLADALRGAVVFAVVLRSVVVIFVSCGEHDRKENMTEMSVGYMCVCTPIP